LPRITINRPLENAKNGEIAADFNYRYMTLRFRSPEDAPGDMRAELGFGLTANLRKSRAEKTTGDSGNVLYVVENWRELMTAPAFDKLLNMWLEGK
jgi:hypothetical protein